MEQGGIGCGWCLHQCICLASSRRGQDLPGGQGLRMGTSCWFRAREGEQYSSPRPTSDQEAQKLAASKEEVGLSMAAWGLLDGLQSKLTGHLPPFPSNPVSVTPFLRPRSRSKDLAKCSHIPFISPVSEQLLQGLFSCVDLFFIVPEIHPEAFGTGTSTASSPSPKYTLTRLSGT